MVVLILGLVFAISFFGTYLIRESRLKHQVFDVPNDRSSHKHPTPRGGGLAIVVSLVVGSILGWFFDKLTLQNLLAISWVSFGLAAIGWYDDIKNLEARRKLLLQVAISIVLIAGLWQINDKFLSHQLIFAIPAVLLFLWLTNLFNFMDGIDSIATIQAIVSTLGALIVFGADQSWHELSWLQVVLAVSCLGFLCFNWPPATIFMGDVGSATIGGIFATMMLIHALITPMALIAWVILLIPFIGDATATLFRRYFRGLNVTEAHRSHAYQRASRYFGSHKQVSVFFGVYTLLICVPLAKVSQFGLMYALCSLLVATLSTLVVVFYFGAGLLDHEGRHAVSMASRDKK